MKFEKIKPNVWISGIYMIVFYPPITRDDESHFSAYYITRTQSNWGDSVARPPHTIKRKTGNAHSPHFCEGWKTFDEAKRDCEKHQQGYEVTDRQIEVAQIAKEKRRLAP